MYLKDRGFTSKDPRDVMAGEYIYNEEDFTNFIGDLIEGNDKYAKERHDLIRRLHAAVNGNSCELICQHFGL